MQNKYKALWSLAGGKVPETWEFHSIESLLESSKSITVGVMYPGDNQSIGVPLVRVSDVKGGRVIAKPEFCISNTVDEEYKRTRLNGSELLITLVGNPGDCVIVNDEMIGWNVARALAVVRLKDPELRGWLRCVLLSLPAKHQIDSRLNTTVQRTLNLKDIKELGIPVPSKKERQPIVQFNEVLERKIELNRQTNETLESMAQALFKSWFVDFDPVIDNALAEGNDIPEVFTERAKQRAAAKKTDRQSDSTSAINDASNYQYLFPAEFEFTEEMGWVPLGWDVKSIEKALLINPRITLKKGSTAKFADMKALPTSGYSISEVIFKEYSGGAKFQKGDVLFARITPCLENGKTGIAYFLDDGEVGFGSTEFIVMRGKDGIDTPFVACLARDENFRIHAQQSMVGSSGRQRVQAACFSSYFLALPNDGVVIEQFHQMANPNFQKALKASKESETLTKLRDTLLPKLLSGELRIPDAEKLAQEALL